LCSFECILINVQQKIRWLKKIKQVKVIDKQRMKLTPKGLNVCMADKPVLVRAHTIF
jgi:hypothetical protein